MKKRMVYILQTAGIVTLLLAGCGTKVNTMPSDDASETHPEKTAASETGSTDTAADMTGTEADSSNREEQSSGSVISEEEARNIALQDAGLTENEVSGIRIKLETDHGVSEYEVDFYADNKEYDYDIDAVSGEIRSKDMDIDEDFQWKTSSVSSETEISEEDAKRIALEKVTGASETDIRLHLDNDDGKMIYEGSIVYNEWEYDFEIDANSGAILEWEEESIYD